LLSPVILLLVFGSMFLTGSVQLPEAARPLPALGVTTTILMSMLQLVANQFGFDRAGFRVFVLSAAPRRGILLGKNFATAPLALGLAGIAVTVVELIYPMRFDHFLAVVPQLIAMYLLFCLLANWLSILAPMPIRAGSLKPINPKVTPILLHMLFLFLFPLAVLPALLPLGIEYGLVKIEWVAEGVPVALPLSLLGCAAVVFLYRLVLPWQGDLLQARELKILEVVTAKAE